MQGDYGEVSRDVTGNTYNSVLTVHVVSAGVEPSGCLKVGELLLGAGEGVHLDSGDGSVSVASSHHDPVLEFNGTCSAENEDDNNINIYSDMLHNYYMVSYGKLKLGVVVSVVVESSSDDCTALVLPPPPMRSIPAGLCQDTWATRASDREWDCSHSPLNVRQLVSVPSPIPGPPHVV